MAHKFYKSATKLDRLPGRISGSSWGKIKKFAHDVWSVNDANGNVVAQRNRAETAKVDFDRQSNEQDNPSIGDIVYLFLSGKKIVARVIDSSDGKFRLSTHDGYVDNIPSGWVRKVESQAQPPRAITREDIPVQNGPAQSVQLDQNQMMIADSLKKLLESRGGKVAIRLSPSTYMVIKSSPGGGVSDEIYAVSTQRADTRSYQSIEHLVRSRGLKDYPEAVDSASFA